MVASRSVSSVPWGTLVLCLIAVGGRLIGVAVSPSWVQPVVGTAASGNISTAEAVSPCTDFYASACALYGPLEGDRGLFGAATVTASELAIAEVTTSPLYETCDRQRRSEAAWWPEAPLLEGLSGAEIFAVLLRDGAASALPFRVLVNKALHAQRYVLELRPDATLYAYAKIRAPHNVVLNAYADTVYASVPDGDDVESEDDLVDEYVRGYVELGASQLRPETMAALANVGNETLVHANGAEDFCERAVSLLTPDLGYVLHTIAYDSRLRPFEATALANLEARILPHTLRKLLRLPWAAERVVVQSTDACVDLVRAIDMATINRALAASMPARPAAVRALLNDVLSETSALMGGLDVSVETREVAVAKYAAVGFSLLGEVVEGLDAARAAMDAWEGDAVPARTFGEHLRRRARRENAKAMALLARDYASDRADVAFRLAWEEDAVPYETVNAWYDPTRNIVTVPPGITLEPFFRGDGGLFDLAVLGTVLGHELGHATDVSGSRFDERGDWVSGGWWAPADRARFQARMSCLAADYGHPCGRADYGLHTMGEDMADQLGLRVTHALAVARLAAAGPSERNTRLREFYVDYARLWCSRPLTAPRSCALVEEDVHALAKHRVNKTLRQLSAFSDVFECRPESSPMANVQRCVVY